MKMRFRPVLLACALLAGFGCGGGSANQDPASQVQVLVVPIEGMISVPTVALVRRALREARGAGISRVVLNIDTEGGLIDSMREVEAVLAALREDEVYTVAWVRSRAFSAGAYIALACRETYMAPGSRMGAITPVVGTLEGIAEIPDDDARQKAYAAMRSDVRALLQLRGAEGAYSPDAIRIVEAMVDPGMRLYKVSYEEGGVGQPAAVKLLDELRDMEADSRFRILSSEPVSISHPVVLTASEAEEWGLSSGLYSSLQELVRDNFGLTMSMVHEMEMSWSETAVAWIDQLKLFLFLFGFILLVVELKTPGIAVPGVLGVLLLSLGMFGSYLVGWAEVTEILLFFLGLAAIGVEIFVMPGTIVFGALGFICVVASLILSQQTFILPTTQTEESILLSNLVNMLLLFVGVIAAMAVLRRFLPQIPILNRVMLEPPPGPMTGGSTRFADPERGERLKGLIGRVGVAGTTLRPAGILELDGDRMDVVTEGDFIEVGTKIRIVQVDGNRIVVVKAEDSDQGGHALVGGLGLASLGLLLPVLPLLPLLQEDGGVSLGILALLVTVGLALVVAEIFFVSFGVLSILAAVALISSVFLAFQKGQFFGFVFLAIAALGAPIAAYFALKWLPDTPVGRRLMLSAPDPKDVSRAAEEPGLHEFLHKTGVALSPLRPAGFARIEGRRVDVVTRGELLEKDSPLHVVEIEGNRVVVARDDGTRGEEDSKPATEAQPEN